MHARPASSSRRVAAHCILAAVAVAQQPAPAPVRAAFAEVAAAVTSIVYDDALGGRFGGRTGPAGADTAPGLRELAALCARADAVDQLLPLLDDTDAKVRTLALLVLFDRDEPRLLPRFAALRSDAAATFDAARLDGVTFIDGKPSGPPYSRSPATVGDVAKRAVGMYLDALRAAVGGPEDFETYWQVRKDRSWCASWLAVALLRAHGGISPTHVESAAAIGAVRARVLALPAPARQLLLLALPTAGGLDEQCDMFATEQERLAAAREIGDEGLLAVLGGKVPGDDADLAAVCADGARRGGRGLRCFVLDHASEVFAPSSAPQLLAFGRGPRKRGFDPLAVEVRWSIAAASLQPEHAAEWLRAAWDRFAAPSDTLSRAALLVAMHDLVGEPLAAWVVDRFWELEEHHSGSPSRIEFVRHLGDIGAGDDELRRTRARRAMQALLAHRGFADADGSTMMAIAYTLNRWRVTAVIPAHEIAALQHPLSMQALQTKEGVAGAAASHPEATARYLATLQSWRERMAASVDSWAPK
jgi:hypothetical protein